MNGETTKKSTPYTVPIGPVHPALKEPVEYVYLPDGRRSGQISRLCPRQYSQGHRMDGHEEEPGQIVHLTDRICGICGVVHSLSFARAVEQIAEIEVPPRG